MRFFGIALVASAVALGACGGSKEDGAATDSANTAVTTPAMTDTTAAGGAAGTTGAAGAMAPITGTTHEVKMIGDDKGYRFEPATLTVKAGDGVKFVMVNGGPHNVAFKDVAAGAKAQLDANISEKMGELASAMKMNAGESITVSFANVGAGTYNYVCTPHEAMGMKGAITVQ